MREKMTPELESVMGHYNSMHDVRRAAKENKDAFQDSIESVKVLLSYVFQRLKRKDQPMKCFSQASPSEMEALWSYILDVDESVSQDDRAKDVSKKKDLQRFMDHCCHYMFGIKKCGVSSCSICRPPRLPPDVFAKIHHLPDPHKDASGEHYPTFDNLYSKMT